MKLYRSYTSILFLLDTWSIRVSVLLMDRGRNSDVKGKQLGSSDVFYINQHDQQVVDLILIIWIFALIKY